MTNEAKHAINKSHFYIDIAQMLFKKFYTIEKEYISIRLSNSFKAIDNCAEFLKYLDIGFRRVDFVSENVLDSSLSRYAKDKFKSMIKDNGKLSNLVFRFDEELDQYPGHFKPTYCIVDDTTEQHVLQLTLTTQLCDQSCMAEVLVVGTELIDYMKSCGLSYLPSDNENFDIDVFLINAQNDSYAKATWEATVKEYEELNRKAAAYDFMTTKPISTIKS